MERCGFFDAHLNGEEYDRVYLADSFAAYFASFINNGVFAEHSDQLQVVSMATPSMQITVRKGQGWINGYWYENTDELYLPIDVADGVLHRIDAIVLRWGSSERTMWLAVNKGQPAISNPQPPALTRNADYYELQLALVSIPASSTNVTQAKITDTRMDASVCGWVTGVVDQIDTTTLFAQFETYFQEFKDIYEFEYDTWFEHIRDQLTEDAAGNLLNLIESLTYEDVGALPAPSGTAPGPITDLVVFGEQSSSYSTGEAMITYEDPADSNWAGTILVRKAVPVPLSGMYPNWPQNPSDGVVLFNNKIRDYYSSGVLRPYRDVGLSSDYTYFYRFFTYNASGKMNTSDSGQMKFTFTPNSGGKVLWSEKRNVGQTFTPNIPINGGRLFYAKLSADDGSTTLRATLIGTYGVRDGIRYITLTGSDVAGDSDFSLRATLSSPDGVTWTVNGATRARHDTTGHTITELALMELGKLL